MLLPEARQVFDTAFREAHRLSATQLDTAILCERKWAYLKLAGLKPPANKYASRGVEVHEALEAWQQSGKPLDLSTDSGKIASAGLKLLPAPGTHRTEHEFNFDSGTAVYHGYMDLRGPATFGIQTVWDHKTTTNFKWMKTPEVLRHDPQAVLYAQAALHEAAKHGVALNENHMRGRVELNWVYYLADPTKPRSRKVQLHIIHDNASAPLCPDNVDPKHFGIMRASELQERFGELEQVAQRLLTLYRDRPAPEELPPTPSACSAYGGCPFKDNPCSLSISEKVRIMEAQGQQTSMSIADKIRNSLKKAASAAETTAPPAANPAPAVAAPAAPVAAPAAAPATTPAAPAALAALRRQQAAVNPPEQANGADPDAPAAAASKAAQKGTATPTNRAELAGLAMQAIIARGTHSSSDPKYVVKVAADSVLLADALIAALGS